jgi:hypothetical protein
MNYNVRCTKCGRFIPENDGINNYTCFCGKLCYNNNVEIRGIPLVELDYPPSEYNPDKPFTTRFVWATFIDADYVKGFEVSEENYPPEKGLFKTFLRDKMSYGPEVVKFHQE